MEGDGPVGPCRQRCACSLKHPASQLPLLFCRHLWHHRQRRLRGQWQRHTVGQRQLVLLRCTAAACLSAGLACRPAYLVHSLMCITPLCACPQLQNPTACSARRRRHLCRVPTHHHLLGAALHPAERVAGGGAAAVVLHLRPGGAGSLGPQARPATAQHGAGLVLGAATSTARRPAKSSVPLAGVPRLARVLPPSPRCRRRARTTRSPRWTCAAAPGSSW